MTDIENPDVDDGSVAEAEPAQCSRRVYMCLVCCVALALVLAFQSFLHFKESHPAETMLGIMVDLGGLLAALVGGWFVLVFAALVADWGIWGFCMAEKEAECRHAPEKEAECPDHSPEEDAVEEAECLDSPEEEEEEAVVAQ
ncbi:hypothetical protein TRIUR3_30833 [Triticum urartu]|uniref:Uncharacterized protein n=1 Tax=Triticum urartu TaxID=4572 RepID=M7YYW1_TRIUA|nr:hypothetical protein TRIUR3_30833 [Triticum urartu]